MSSNTEKAIFLEALEKAPGSERETWLASACGDDQPLLRRVEYLLQLDSEGGDEFLETPSSPIKALFERATPRKEIIPDSQPTIGDYQIEEELFHSSNSIVYRAQQKGLNRPVAIKMVRQTILNSESDLIRFRQEAKAAANLDHPNITPIYDIGEWEGQAFFSMKLLKGGNLRERIDDFSSDLKKGIEMMLKVCHAIDTAHQNGVIHRDLKPSNILFDSQMVPYVADFGLAKLVEDSLDQTLTGQIIGTPSYMAPEQARDDQPLTHLCDIYGIGSILYFILTGHAPFRGENVVVVLEKLRSEEVTPPSTVNPDIDQDLETITLKCLQKLPADRYQSAAEVAEELSCWLEGKPISARPLSLLQKAKRSFEQNPEVIILMIVSAALASIILTVIALKILDEFVPHDRFENWHHLEFFEHNHDDH